MAEDTAISSNAARRMALRDSFAIAALLAVTLILFAVTLLLFHSFTRHSIQTPAIPQQPATSSGHTRPAQSHG